MALNQKNKYWWLFPFNLKFEFKNTFFTFSNFPEGERLLVKLGLISQTPVSLPVGSNSGAAKCQTPTNPLTPVWQKSKYKKSRPL